MQLGKSKVTESPFLCNLTHIKESEMKKLPRNKNANGKNGIINYLLRRSAVSNCTAAVRRMRAAVAEAGARYGM